MENNDDGNSCISTVIKEETVHFVRSGSMGDDIYNERKTISKANYTLPNSSSMSSVSKANPLAQHIGYRIIKNGSGRKKPKLYDSEG